MNAIRAAVGWVGVALMAGGYLASVYFALAGDPAPYVKALDASAVPMLSLVLLAAAVVLAFLPSQTDKADDEEGQT
ncbi:MAG: hypothetical protein JSS65_09220 [Armatimonadetes bacterium]|nr:hypothetical protein [Armatimonadota bacterium]